MSKPMRVRLKRQSPPAEAPAPEQRPERPALRLVESSDAHDPGRSAPRVDRAGRRRQDPHSEQRRLAAEDRPEDSAVYSCECGYVFEAGVTTSVCCPNCGRGQAW